MDDAAQPVVPEVITAIPSGIVAEPGKDVFAKDNRESRSSARIEADQEVVSGDAERVVSVVGGEASGTLVVEGQVVESSSSEAEVVGSAAATVDEVAEVEKRPVVEGPMDHEEALADQVAHELYPEARDVSGEGLGERDA